MKAFDMANMDVESNLPAIHPAFGAEIAAQQIEAIRAAIEANIADAKTCIRNGKGKAHLAVRLVDGGSRWTFPNLDYCADFEVRNGEIVELFA